MGLKTQPQNQELHTLTNWASQAPLRVEALWGYQYTCLVHDCILSMNKTGIGRTQCFIHSISQHVFADQKNRMNKLENKVLREKNQKNKKESQRQESARIH